MWKISFKIFVFVSIFSTFLMPNQASASASYDTAINAGNFYISSTQTLLASVAENTTDISTKVGNFYTPLFDQTVELYQSLGEVALSGLDKIPFATDVLGETGKRAVWIIYNDLSIPGNAVLSASEHAINVTGDSWSDASTQIASAGGLFGNIWNSTIDKFSNSLVPLFRPASSTLPPSLPSKSNTQISNPISTPTLPPVVNSPSRTTIERIISTPGLTQAELISRLASLKIEILDATNIFVKNKIAEVPKFSGFAGPSVTTVVNNGGGLSSPVGVTDGGTGVIAAPSYGQLLLGNSSGGYDLVATSSLGITSGSTVTGTTGQLAYFSGTDTAVGTSTVFISPAGNVGVGTTTPGSVFSVGNTNGINFSTATSTFSSTGGINLAAGCFAVGGVCLSSYSDSLVNSYIHASTTIPKLYTANAFTGTNTFSGNVGIGTTTPYAKFSVVGEVVAANFTATTTATSTFSGPIQFATYSNTPQISSPDGVTGIHFDSAGQISFHTNGSQKAIFNSLGQLGLASTTPWGLLSINPDGITGPSFVIGSSTATNFVVTNAGSVGIGTTSPASPLTVVGSAQLAATLNSSSGITFSSNAFSLGNNSYLMKAGNTGNGSIFANTGTFAFYTGSTVMIYNGVPFKPNSDSTTAFQFQTNGGTSVLSVDTSNQRIGIGTTTPNMVLTIGGSLTTTAASGLNFGGDVTSNLYRNAAGSIKTDGSFTVGGNINYLGGALGNSITGTTFLGTGNDNGVTIQSRAFSTAGKVAVTMSSGSVTNSSGTITAVAITPTYNQTSTAGGTDLLINRTQTAVGSGAQLLFDAQVGGVSKFVINNQGYAGVGTTTPWGLLSINPNGITGPSFVIGSSTATSLIVTNGGNVGIGTTTPGSILSLGNTNGINFSTTATSTFSGTGGGVNIATGCYAVAGVCVGGGGSSQWTTSGSNIYYTTGNIGIGTTTAPTAMLSLYNTLGTANIDFTSASSTLFTLGTDGSDNGNFKISTPSFGGSDVFVIASNVVSTSYSNPGGTGNRTSLITVTDSGGILFSNNTSHLINGSNGNGDWFVAGALSSSNWIKFDFGLGHPKVIQEATYTQQTSATQGVWKWQGSNDDSAWTDIGSSFTLGGATTDIITELSSNTVGYRYYRMVGVSGSTNSGPVVYQMDFKITESTGGLPYVGINDIDPSAALDVTGWGSGTNFTFRTQNSLLSSSFAVLDNGNVGVGTTTPFAAFAVNPTAGQASNQFVIGSSTATSFIINNSGNVGIGTTTPYLGPLSLASGAYVTTGGTWTNASDKNLKENFKEVDENSILDKISALSITQWNYKSEATSTMHIGPMAQDFFATFGLGGSNTSISTIDPAGIALLGIKAINLNLSTIASSTASSTPASLSFASSFFDSIYRHIAEWMANAGNGIVSIFSKKVVTDELCVGSTCVTELQLQALLLNAGQEIQTVHTDSQATNTGTSTATETTSTTTEDTANDTAGAGGDTSTSGDTVGAGSDTSSSDGVVAPTPAEASAPTPAPASEPASAPAPEAAPAS